MLKKRMGLALFCILFLCGCSGQSLQNDLSQIRIAEGRELTNGLSNASRAVNIKESVMKLEELQGACVVVEGNTALIGLRLKEQWLQEAMRIKKEAGNLAKEADDTLESTSVTTNENITRMIERMEHKRS